MVRRIALVLGVVGLAGCSLLIDNGAFVGSPDGSVVVDAGPVDDGGFDAGPDAPSMPVVHIEPAAPSPGDALTAVIDTESVDPLMAGAIRYEYRWLRGGTDAMIAMADVPSGTIANGETWRVEVTPVTTDDRRGAAGSAMVTVGNSPPTLSTVGLSTYRPIQEDTLEALPGVATDPDGDTLRVAYEWYRDDTLVTGETSSRLRIRPEWPAGTRVRVEARAVDASDASSAAVRSADSLVVANVPRWRQLLPDRNRVVATVRDTRHERIVLVVEQPDLTNHLWEHDLGSDSFVRLRPSVPVEGRFQAGSFFTTDGRLFRVDDTGSIATIDVLNTTERGAELWSTITLSTPVTGVMTGGTFDAESGQLYLGLRDDGTGAHDLVRIDIAASPAIPEVLVNDISAAITAAAWAHGRSRNEILLFGGGDESDVIHRIDLASGTPTLDELATRLPVRFSAGLATYDEMSGRYVVGFGGNLSEGAARGVWWFDPEAASFEPVDVGGATLSIGRGWLGVDHSGEMLYSPGTENPFSYPRYELFRVDRSANDLVGSHVPGVDLPPGSYGSFAGRTVGGLAVYGGTDRDGAILSGLWRFPFSTDGTHRDVDLVSATADPVEGEPGARTILGSSSGNPLIVFGGRDDSARVAGSVFQFEMSSWEALTASTASPVPSARTGVAAYEGCDTFSIFGGEDAAGLSDEVWRLECRGTCTWTRATLGGIGPSARTESAFSPAGVLYGGRSAGGVQSDVYYLPGCSPSWTPITLSQPIGPRSGHGMTASVLFGGFDGTSYRNETYLLEMGAGTELVVTPIVPPGDGDGAPAGRSQMAIADDWTYSRVYVYGGFYGARPPFGAEDRVFADLWELRPR